MKILTYSGSSSKQWAAVNIHWFAIIEPPQQQKKLPLFANSMPKATCEVKKERFILKLVKEYLHI